jgi:hypothetical protein
MRRVTVAERRARLARRHGLAAGERSTDPAVVASRLVAVHGTDASSVYLEILARLDGGDRATVDHALYGDRTLIRVLAMRRTVFVTTPEIAAVALAGAGREVAARERRKLAAMLAGSGVPGDPVPWLAAAEQAALQVLTAAGEATAADLAAADPKLGRQIVLSRGKDYQGKQNVASRLLLILGAEGKVVRARPRGSWTSHQYRWAPMERWLPGGLPAWDPVAAEADLARRWLAAYGPGTAEDLQWWAGWTKTQTRRALATVGPAEADLEDGGTGLVLADDDAPAEPVEPWLALLPALDATPMGWQARSWFLGEHGPKVFDRTGNIGPSLWWDGRIVGGWAHRPDGEIVCRFLEDVGADAIKAAEVAAGRLSVLTGGTRLTARARGRTWLEEELGC